MNECNRFGYLPSDIKRATLVGRLLLGVRQDHKIGALYTLHFRKRHSFLNNNKPFWLLSIKEIFTERLRRDRGGEGGWCLAGWF